MLPCWPHPRQFLIRQRRVVGIGQGICLDLLFGHRGKACPVWVAFAQMWGRCASGQTRTIVPSDNFRALTISSSIMDSSAPES